MKADPARAGSAGFTLLELALAMMLLALLILVSYGTLHLCLKGARHEETATANLQQLRVAEETATANLQQLRVARQFIERSLGSALPRLKVRGSWPYFEGEMQEVKYLTPVPLRAHLPGGVYHQRLLAVPDEQGVYGLALEEVKGFVWLEDPERIETRLFLLRGVSSLRFTYLSGGEEFNTWHADRQKGLPDKVRVSLTLGREEPVEWLIPIRVVEAREESEGERGRVF